MYLPSLYKYLDVQGAMLTLGNGTFKHAKPSDFNDIEDLTIQSIFPEETEAALKIIENGFIDVLLQHLNEQPTCSSPMREKIELLQYTFRTNQNAAKIIKDELNKEDSEPIYSVEHMRGRAEVQINIINAIMQDYRVLCVTTHKDSEDMWSRYAENHKGVMLRVEPNIAKDSIFKLFRPVEYREKRPPLYNDTLNFIAEAFFGDQNLKIKAIINTILYSKTLDWQPESEYRLAMPLAPSERPWDVLKFHPEEITELYLGLSMAKEDMEEIILKAKMLNPGISIFQVNRNADTKLIFNQI